MGVSIPAYGPVAITRNNASPVYPGVGDDTCRDREKLDPLGSSVVAMTVAFFTASVEERTSSAPNDTDHDTANNLFATVIHD